MGYIKFKAVLEKKIVRSGIRTHAYISRLRPERSALDRSAILTAGLVSTCHCIFCCLIYYLCMSSISFFDPLEK